MNVMVLSSVIKIQNVKSAVVTDCNCIEVVQTAPCISFCGVCYYI